MLSGSTGRPILADRLTFCLKIHCSRNQNIFQNPRGFTLEAVAILAIIV